MDFFIGWHSEQLSSVGLFMEMCLTVLLKYNSSSYNYPSLFLIKLKPQYFHNDNMPHMLAGAFTCVHQ